MTRKPKAVETPPPIPPQSIEHLMLQRALADVTEDNRRDIVAFMVGVGSKEKRKPTKAQSKANCDALMKFAALGYAFYAWTNSET